MLFTRLLSNPANPDANEKNKTANNWSQPEYDAKMKQIANPNIPMVVKNLRVFLTLKYSLLIAMSLKNPKAMAVKKFKICGNEL